MRCRRQRPAGVEDVRPPDVRAVRAAGVGAGAGASAGGPAGAVPPLIPTDHT
jgi:hypothetical protein